MPSVVITLATVEDIELESVDIVIVFLNREINADIYMDIPEGVKIEKIEGPGWVLKLLKVLYEIKQGPCCWPKCLLEVINKLEFR